MLLVLRLLPPQCVAEGLERNDKRLPCHERAGSLNEAKKCALQQD